MNILAFLTILSSGCIEKEQLTVPQEELVLVLTEIHLLEAALMDLPDQQTKDSLSQGMYDQVLGRNNISKQVFETNMDILKRNPTLAKETYAKVLDELEVRGIESKTKGGKPK